MYCMERQSRRASLTQDGLTGSAWGDWANYTASPLRAFESELGVQAPVGLLAWQVRTTFFGYHWIDVVFGKFAQLSLAIIG